MIWLKFTICCLATFRLALLVSKEDGPAWLFRKLRNIPAQHSSARKGIRCEWCVSVYASALITFIAYHACWIQTWTEAGIYWLAFSAAAICINQAFTAK